MMRLFLTSRLGIAALFLLVACGHGPDESSVDGTSGARPPRAHADEREVVIRMTDNMRFEPENVTVSPGDTVVWINVGDLPHTSTDMPGTAGIDEHNVLPAEAPPWDSGQLEPGERFTLVFTVEGDYTYVCTIHEVAGMIGRLTVR
jgi:plastocyanin